MRCHLACRRGRGCRGRLGGSPPTLGEGRRWHPVLSRMPVRPHSLLLKSLEVAKRAAAIMLLVACSSPRAAPAQSANPAETWSMYRGDLSRSDRPGSGTARWGVLRFMDLTARHRVVGGASMRLRLFSLLSAAALFMLGAVPASATSEGHDYLALGDSVPFGFSPLLNPNDAHNFVGYPEIVAQGLDVKDVNAACPGEATGGFLLLTGTDNVCRPYRASFPLHVEYQVSQMDFTLRYLTGHRDTRLITLTLGANDVFHLQNVCGAAHPGDPTAFAACVNQALPAVLATMRANLNTILSQIRATGYDGLIVAGTHLH